MVQFTKDAGNVCTTEWATHARGVRLACKSMVTVEWIRVYSGETYQSP